MKKQTNAKNKTKQTQNSNHVWHWWNAEKYPRYDYRCILMSTNADICNSLTYNINKIQAFKQDLNDFLLDYNVIFTLSNGQDFKNIAVKKRLPSSFTFNLILRINTDSMKPRWNRQNNDEQCCDYQTISESHVGHTMWNHRRLLFSIVFSGG